jgi:predicted transcriptional regulator with HTH domain
MLIDPAMLRSLNFADVAVRAEGDGWIVVDHADRRLLEQRFSDRFSAISLGLLVARQQGGAVWLDEFEDTTTRPAHMHIFH